MANGVSSLHYMEIINYRFMCRKGRLGTCSMAEERAVRGGNQTSHWGIRRGTKRVMGTLLRLQIFVLELLAVIDKRVILLWCLVTKMEAIYQGQEVWLGVSMQCS